MIGESVIGELTIAGDVVAAPPTPPIVITPGSAVAIYVTKATRRKYVAARHRVSYPTRSVHTNYVQKVKRG